MGFSVGFLVFPDVQQLDLTGPYEVFASTPGVTAHLVWKELGNVSTVTGMTLVADETFKSCPNLDVLCVPGGRGIGSLMEDLEVRGFIRRQAACVKYLTSVCTGALLLGAAGLLQGRRATSHWAFHALLAHFGAIPVRERVVIDNEIITGGGVTAGIDFALTVVSCLMDVRTAQYVQLQLEYAPAPPFSAGLPDTAPGDVVAQLLSQVSPIYLAREEVVLRVVESLRNGSEALSR